MAAFPGEFDDSGEDEFSRPLPPEDRLWRHPSELGSEDTLRLDATAVRNRWLSSSPSRASAWTAGLVGALLASGVVVLGTHLATALTGRSTASGPVTLTSIGAPPAPAAAPAAVGLGTGLVSAMQRVGRSVVDVLPTPGGAALGVIISDDGSVLTSAASLAKATSILVTLPNGAQVPAVAIAEDPTSGLAVLRVNGASGQPVAPLAAEPVGADSLAVALTQAGGHRAAIGTVSAVDGAPSVDGDSLVDALSADFASVQTPPGSPILNAQGNVVGIVVGPSQSGVAAVPSWIAMPVSKELMTAGAVHHGWIGIEGVSANAIPGVLVTVVDAAGASAEAGIVAGDVITALDGSPVTSMPELKGRLYVMRPGARVTVAIDHDGTRLVRQLRLDD